ncbi:potassium-transporting ATPase subunit F [Siphonobacter aquaeclarae]|uniref:potassium-transporting ATPase subunit F n=1 Tax=Siphonobacter aquaeclarae TaxID=563176 RepID=UPI001C40A936
MACAFLLPACITNSSRHAFHCSLVAAGPVLLLALFQIGRILRKNLIAMFSALFFLSLLVFGYMIYVLLKPEKF